MDKKVAIILRVFNRLEYTIKCIEALANNTNYKDLEVIVIDNCSTDWTQHRFERILKYDCTKNWLKSLNIRYFRQWSNLGDWWGMVKWLEYTDAEYVVQLDNDIIVHKNWLKELVYVFEQEGCVAVMHKRNWIVWDQWILKHTNPRKCAKFVIGDIGRPVACYITHRNTILEADKICKKEWSGSKYAIWQQGKVIKILQPWIDILDIKDTVDWVPLNYVKYDRSEMNAFI